METSFDPLELKYSKWLFGMGTLCVRSEMECYNKKANGYLANNYTKSISNIFNESYFKKLNVK